MDATQNFFSERHGPCAKFAGEIVLKRFCIEMKDNAPPVSFVAVVEITSM